MTSYKKTMRQALEEMYPIVEEVELDEAKYELYHKDFSSAMQHAYHVAKKHHGITIDPKEIDDKVATGPSKPSEGKTNKYRLKGDKGAVQIQVYNKGGSKPFELNMYKEEVELDEGTIDKVKDIASKKSAAKIDGVMVDSFTASAISQIYDKVNDANKKKMEKLPITKLANLAFKMMNKEELAKIKGNTPADKGRKSAVEDDIERAEKKGDKKEVEKLKEEDLDEAQDGGDFKPHMMYDPKTGKGYKADTMDDHLRMKKMGYTHDAPKKEEVEIDEAIPKSEYYYVDPKGVVVAVGSKDAMRKMNMKQAKDGNKGGSFSQNSKKYKVGDKIKEEVEFDEAKMTFGTKRIPDAMKKKGMDKVKTKGLNKDKSSAAYIGKMKKEEDDLDEGKMKDLLIKAQELMGPSKNRKEGIQMVAKGLKVSEKEATKLVDAVIKMNEESDLDEGFINIGGAKVKDDEKSILQHIKKTFPNVKKVRKDPQHGWIPVFEESDLVEGKMSQLHQYIKDKKSAEEIAKLMKVDVATIKKLMSSYNVEDVEEGAAADARRAMKKDKDFSRKDRADDDDSATDDDVKAASKNIMMQMRKAISLRGRFDVEFADGKKVKIPAKMAQLATKKYSEKKPADKEKFQARIGKSYKDMLSALKEELQPQKESILERMNRKIKENKNG